MPVDASAHTQDAGLLKPLLLLWAHTCLSCMHAHPQHVAAHVLLLWQMTWKATAFASSYTAGHPHAAQLLHRHTTTGFSDSC